MNYVSHLGKYLNSLGNIFYVFLCITFNVFEEMLYADLHF